MWDANPDVWSMSAPVMFPVCGCLRDDKFIYEGNYICLEPWCNAPDDIDSDYDFVNKVGIICLEKGEYKEKIHTITYEE